MRISLGYRNELVPPALKLIMIILIALPMMGCLSTREYASIATVGGLAMAEASVDDAEKIKAIAVEIDETITESGEVDLVALEAQVDLAIAKLPAHLRGPFKAVKKRIVIKVAEALNQDPFTNALVQLKQVAAGVIDGCEIHIEIVRGSGTAGGPGPPQLAGAA